MKTNSPILSFKGMNWKAILLFSIALFYVCLIVIWLQEKNSPLHYGGDYLAFWSAGRIADEKGFSQIYDLQALKDNQTQALVQLGILRGQFVLTPNPAPYFPMFIVPFKYLSRINIQESFWTWTVLNLLFMIGYLFFFIKKVILTKKAINYSTVILVSFSFAVFDNFVNGQLNVFLLIFVGEFIRNAISGKLFLSGCWVGFLLLKPQLLILILPVFLIMENWKTLAGFFSTLGIILMTSLLLSGYSGIRSLLNLWTKYSAGIATNAPEVMINWRMVGVSTNTLFTTSLGWIATGLGMVSTLIAVLLLIKSRPFCGSSKWVVTVLGLFSATLAITWHAHAHMAMVLIPLLVYASSYKLLSERTVFFWAVFTPVVWFALLLLGLTLQKVTNVVLDLQGVAVAVSGFIANMVVLIAVFRSLRFNPQINQSS